MLFRDLSTLGEPSQTADVPTLILLHHLLARGGLALPHQVRGWTETEYVRWLNEHQEEDRIRLIEEVVEKERAERSERPAEPPAALDDEGDDDVQDRQDPNAAQQQQQKSEAARTALEIVDKVLRRGGRTVGTTDGTGGRTIKVPTAAAPANGAN